MKRLTGFTALVLFSMFYCAGNAFAAGESFELNLNELRPAPAKPVKSQHRKTHKASSAAPTSDGTENQEGQSSYIVKPGDHLFLILMHRYGLSNDAAERLIPEVMRLNGISNPKGLTVGQRLTIPLPSSAREARSRAETMYSAQPEPAQISQPDHKPEQGAQTPQTKPVAAANERQVTISAAPPCILARSVMEHLGMIARQIKPLPDSAFTAGTADLKLVVACGLTPEESYTYRRLLALHDARLLVFKGDETPRRVIEELAEQLGFSFRMADPAASDSLPLTYVFPAEGPYDQDVRLTIGAQADGGNHEAR